MFIIRLFFVLSALCLKAPDLDAQASKDCLPGFMWDGAKCVSCIKPCDTGLKGACGRGLTNCATGGKACEVTVKPGERMEVCNGEDDDCDGEVDEGFDKDKDTYTTCGGDCDDRDAARHPDAVERCDGSDNDCNGVVDDGFNIGSTCTVGRGACAEKGKRKCYSDGSGVLCDAIAGSPNPENCDGIDNDCDGIVDNGLGEISCGIGACRQTVPLCKDGKVSRCTPIKAAAELCGDGVDNDCDGKIDEDFSDLKKACRAGAGICERAGILVCSEDKLFLKCNAVAGQPEKEICGNRKDEDCNGVVDDAAGLNEPCDNGQVGECNRPGRTICDVRRSEIVCSAAKIEPRPEKCDELDNDCDGVIDNGVKNECGTCGVLPAKVGGACLVNAADICSTGVWECNRDKPGLLICSPRFDLSANSKCPDDGNICTRDFCHEGVCTHPDVPDGLPCNDANACTMADSCEKGLCSGAGLLSCDDGNPCTEDVCDVLQGCAHNIIGGGFVNSCGSCEILKAEVGEPCPLTNLSGICAAGLYRCTPDNDMACVQALFARNEICNGLDDDCDGLTDEEQGETTCGTGSCETTVLNCVNGKVQKCVPLPPAVESCANMDADDNCDGVADNIAGLDVECPVKVGTCIIPGKYRCAADKSALGCEIANQTDMEDADGDGMPNYCDRDDVASVSRRERYSRIYDPEKTRAVMLPWTSVYSSAVTSLDVKYSWLIVSGNNATENGVAFIPVRDIFEKSHLMFHACVIPEADIFQKMTVTPDGELFAASRGFYYRVLQIPQKLSEGMSSACSLRADAVLTDESRPWSSETCKVERITSVAAAEKEKNLVAGTVICSRKGKQGLGLDIVSLMQSSVGHSFIPLWEGAIDSAEVSTVDGKKSGFEIVATVDKKTSTAFCKTDGAQWNCEMNSKPVSRSSAGESGARLPRSSIDDVFAGGEMTFVNPHAQTRFAGKEYGGPDLFTVFDIKEGGRQIGTMGFFYWNENEPPECQINDIKFDGKKGVAKFGCKDPAGDLLQTKVHLEAGHGGSLDHWIENADAGEVRFSAKGEAAASVGVWPISLVIVVTDAGGATLTSIAVIAHDGTVESIREVVK